MSSLERAVTRYVDLSFGSSQDERNGLCGEEQLSEILKAESPCLVVIKPHAADSNDTEKVLENFIGSFGLTVLVKSRLKMSEGNVFCLYGDLLEVQKQGPDGVEFVKGLTSSFIGGESIVYVVSGPDSYHSMKVTKKLLRDAGSEDRFRNVMHSSDNLTEAMREINALLAK